MRRSLATAAVAVVVAVLPPFGDGKLWHKRGLSDPVTGHVGS